MQLLEPDRTWFAAVNRTSLRLWEWGDPAAFPVVCVHGAYDHGRMWDGLAPELAALGYRVIAVDVRGHGDSGRLSSGHVWAASALDLALLIRSLGPSAGLVGHSFGGGQALFVASVWPELVDWVVNLDGLGPPPAAFADVDLAEQATRGLVMAERALFGSPRCYGSLEEMVERRQKINFRLPPEWVEHLVRHGSRPQDGGFTWKVDPMFSVGLPAPFAPEHLAAEHRHVRCPVLALTGGEHDTWSEMTDDELEQRLATLPQARHRVIDGAGHYLHHERPAAVLAEVNRFLGSLPR